MKKNIWVVCLLALLLPACSVKKPESTTPTTEYTHDVFELTFETKLISNDSVGNDWCITYFYKNQPIQSGFRFDQWVGIFCLHHIRVEIREKDKIVDVGEGVLTVASVDGASDTIEIMIVEQGGKYEGNTAVWEVTCHLKLVGKKTVPTDHFPDAEQLASAGCFFICSSKNYDFLQGTEGPCRLALATTQRLLPKLQPTPFLIQAPTRNIGLIKLPPHQILFSQKHLTP